MRNLILVFYLSLAALLSESCSSDSFQRRSLTIIGVKASHAEVSEDRRFVDFVIAGARLSIRPFYDSKYQTGVELLLEDQKAISVSGFQVSLSSVPAEQTFGKVWEKRGVSPLSQYYYRVPKMRTEGELKLPLIVSSNCEIGLLDTSIEKHPKFYRFVVVVETGGLPFEIEIVASA